ncbi:MAG: DNA cytosine methyltransferase [Ruminococcus flavefaciens]|nr:DNA cytosine methyltransferase [Ruminococcus flavefaciens]MCM1059269.1 DNA cytosine methyltransferase [Eubacterium sp.]
MNVLSLFDGISCGMVALERAEIPVEKYSAYEIDKYALTVSKKNYPEIEQYGDVFEGNFKKHKGCDLLIGGSPCTFWSVAKKDRETTPDGEGFRMFMQYIRALEESSPKYFLYENNFSIHKDIKTEISKFLGVEPIMINSALVSAQHRKRCYWTNIPNIMQPEDKGILLKDIIISGIPWQNKSYAYTTRCQAATFKDTLERHRHTMIAKPVILNDINGKARTIKAQYKNTGIPNAARADGFGATMVAEPVTKPIHIGKYGSGGQGQRIYSVHGKSVTLSANGGGKGAKTGLYKIDLPDGDYIIRKLYPIEAERLQTLPDNYTEGVSDTQRYKGIGNGWTVDVIAHILGFMPK